MAILGVDGKYRCFGGEKNKELQGKYHDKEWGVPSYDDLYLFEMLTLHSLQAGLSFSLILQKREAYRKVFFHFDPQKIVKMSDENLEEILLSGKIIANKKKTFAIRQNARVFLQIQKEFGSFSHFLWSFFHHPSTKNHWPTFSLVPCLSVESQELSSYLKKRGMSFIGPKIIYSYMQAIGIVTDHAQDCWLYNK